MVLPMKQIQLFSKGKFPTKYKVNRILMAATGVRTLIYKYMYI